MTYLADSWKELVGGCGIRLVVVSMELGLLTPNKLLNNQQVCRRIREWLAGRMSTEVIWNNTSGTLQIFLGMYQGLTESEVNHIIRSMLYLDTSQKASLWLARFMSTLT